ncbi:MAG TPA: DUF3828 domain-containing protein [Thermoanaerobaculia bacterium]|nr:DUF3828 domain-containing protein [Thermoanaerobaculia bacterium]
MKLFAIALLTLALALSASAATPIDTVAQLYRVSAWEAIFTEPDWTEQQLIDQPAAVLQKYFDEQLSKLILRDRECVAKTQEICRLDFDPIWDSQDPGAEDLKVLPGPRPNTVKVEFLYPGDGEKIQLVYRMTKTPKGWRISDIEYKGGLSLLKILSAKL